MLNLGQGYWECRRVGGTHTRDTVETGTTGKYVAPYLLRVPAQFLLSELRPNYINSNLHIYPAFAPFPNLKHLLKEKN